MREVLALPLEQRQTEHDVASLESLAAKVQDDATRNYIEEAIKCLQAGALRASVVFLWTGTVARIRDEIWRTAGGKPRPIDTAIKAKRRGARDFKKKDDFSYVQDADLLMLAQDMGVFDKNEKGELSKALDLRNSCGHPTKYSPGEKKVAGLIEDVISIVFK
jgi:hypothetical protein